MKNRGNKYEISAESYEEQDRQDVRTLIVFSIIFSALIITAIAIIGYAVAENRKIDRIDNNQH